MKKRILVVMRDFHNRSTMATMLAAHGLDEEVALEERAATAHRYLEVGDTGIAVVITDDDGSPYSAIWLHQRLSMRAATSGIRVVFWSGNIDREVRKEAERHDGLFIDKSQKGAERKLVSAIRRTLASRRAT